MGLTEVPPSATEIAELTQNFSETLWSLVLLRLRGNMACGASALSAARLSTVINLGGGASPLGKLEDALCSLPGKDAAPELPKTCSLNTWPRAKTVGFLGRILHRNKCT